MPTSPLALQSPDCLAADLASPWTCPMVVITDIDGTLRDPRTQSLAPADLALTSLASHGIPVVLAAEGPAGSIVALQERLGLVHPFICHDGRDTAEIRVPTGYFSDPAVPRPRPRSWDVIELGPCESRARAVRLLRSLYRSWNDGVILIGLGDEWTDRFVLSEVDIPVIVRNDDVEQTRLMDCLPQAFVTRQAGPAGWAEAILGAAANG